MSPTDLNSRSLEDVLRKLHLKCKKNNLARIVAQVSSNLAVLQGESPHISDDVASELTTCLRRTIAPLYAAFPLESLELACAVFRQIYEKNVLTVLSKRQKEPQTSWESILTSLLSGILDFLDASEGVKINKAKDAIAATFYPTLCEYCFSLLTTPMTGVDFRCMAYTLLSDSAASHASNQRILRDPQTLGGVRLGQVLWKTRDYLALESLLNLFARILPSTKQHPNGTERRAAFIQSVFVTSSPQFENVGHRIAKILECIRTSDWDETSRKIMEAFADADIAFPQPFVVAEVRACGEQKSSDSLYVDSHGIIANVLIGEDECEAMKVPYNTMTKIEVVQERHYDAEVAVYIDSPPIVGSHAITKGPSGNGGLWTVVFNIRNDRVQHFLNVLHSRGLGKLIKNISHPKLSLVESPTMLEFDSRGKPFPELSQAERIEAVKEFYHTNQSSDDISPDTPKPNSEASTASHPNALQKPCAVQQHVSGPPPCAFKDKVAPDILGRPRTQISCDSNALSPCPVQTPALPQRTCRTRRRTESQKMRDDVFGANDEELSEISDADSDSPPAPALKPSVIRRKSRLERTETLEMVSVALPRPPRTRACRQVIQSDSDDSHLSPTRDLKTQHECNERAILLSGSEPAEAEPLTSPKIPTAVTPVTACQKSVIPPTPTKPTKGKSLPGKVQHPTVSGSLNAKSDRKITSDSCPPLSKTALPEGAKRISDAPEEPTVLPITASAVSVTDASDTSSVTASNKPYVQNANIVARPTSDNINSLSYSPSPVPGMKPERVPIKARMRKKNETIPTEEVRGLLCVKSSKRKRSIADADVERELSSATKTSLLQDDGALPILTKRLRATGDSEFTSAPTSDVLSKGRVSQILRPRTRAAARATERYRGKKDKTSSPRPLDDLIDYDALPEPSEISARTLSSPLARDRRENKTKNTPETGISSKAQKNPRQSHPRKTKGKQNVDSPAHSPKAKTDRSVGVGRRMPPKIVTVEHIEARPTTQCLDEEGSYNPECCSTPCMEILKAAEEDPRDNEMSKKDVKKSIVTNKRNQTAPENIRHVDNTAPAVKRSNRVPWKNLTRITDNQQIEEEHFVVENDSNDTTHNLHIPQSPAPLEPEHRVADIDVHSSENPEDITKNDIEVHPPENVCPQDDDDRDEDQSELPAKSLANTFNLQLHDDTVDLTFVDSPAKDANNPATLSTLLLPDAVVDRAFKAAPARKPLAFSDSEPSALPEARLTRPRHSVTFAPMIEQRSSSLKMSTKPLNSPEDTSPASHSKIRPVTPTRDILEKLLSSETSGGHAKLIGTPVTKKRTESSVRDIIEVINDIHEVIIGKVMQRFEGVREDARIGRDTILLEAANDLKKLHAERASHLQRLIDLESEYAKFGRSMTSGYESVMKLNREACDKVSKLIEAHDRTTLVKRMPASLGVLPECFRA